MLQTPQESVLKETCDKLEKALLTPVLSGELVSWVTALQDATDDLQDSLHQFVEESLHSDYAEIAKSDMELASRIEQMVDDEKKLLEQQTEFRRILHLLAEHAPQVQSDEAKIADERLKVEKQGLSLVTELKRLQTKASTWLQEAVFRDRGPVD